MTDIDAGAGAPDIAPDADAQAQGPGIRILAQFIRTARRGGVWLRFALIFCCDLTDTAWLGGSV